MSNKALLILKFEKYNKFFILFITKDIGQSIT